jgi:hypothetical protein
MSYPFSRTWWIKEGQILGGRYPGVPEPEEGRQMLTALIDARFTLMVNLQPEDELGLGGRPFPDYAATIKELAAERGAEAEMCRFPIPDVSIPKPALMRKILDRIDAEIAQSGKVYVHCWGGHGRTATVGGCWMVRQGMTAEKVLQQITKNRSHDEVLASHHSPETPDQQEFIRGWSAHDAPRTKTRVNRIAKGPICP